MLANAPILYHPYSLAIGTVPFRLDLDKIIISYPVGEARLKFVVLGGEKFPSMNDIRPSVGRGTQFYNAYGVTEMSVWQSLVKVHSRCCGEVPISADGDSMWTEKVDAVPQYTH